jgi:hypothetical protein
MRTPPSPAIDKTGAAALVAVATALPQVALAAQLTPEQQLSNYLIGLGLFLPLVAVLAFAALRAGKKAHDPGAKGYATFENVNDKSAIRKDAPAYRVVIHRQSGNVQRTVDVATFESALSEVRKSFRPGPIDE